MTADFDQPLKLAPCLVAKQWGGRRLARLGKHLPAGAIGEALESGNAARIVGGPCAGHSLGALARQYPDALLGHRGRLAAGLALDFPLLVKFIDAHEYLSVQVHPSDAQAPTGQRGKCEAWLVLDAGPDSELIIGVTGAVDLEHLDAQLVRHAARAGDVLLVLPGTLHAIGAGVLLYEIQQPSDVTYRVFDWDRQRELHVAEGAAIARDDGQAVVLVPVPWRPGSELLVACAYFAVERRTFGAGAGEAGLIDALPESPRVLTLLDGRLTIGAVTVESGESVVLPAAMPAQPCVGIATALIAWVPDVQREIAEPLRQAGFDEARIALFTGGGLAQ